MEVLDGQRAEFEIKSVDHRLSHRFDLLAVGPEHDLQWGCVRIEER